MGASGTDGSRHKEGALGASPKGAGAGRGAGRSSDDFPGGAETVWDIDAGERGAQGTAWVGRDDIAEVGSRAALEIQLWHLIY